MSARRTRHWSDVLAATTVALAPLMVARESGATSATNTPPVRATSVSEQFTVYAPNPLLPSAVCVLAERVKHVWLDHLDLADRWRNPIVIVINERGASETDTPAVRADVFRTDVRLKYQIRCLVPPPLDESALVKAIFEALCVEFANREQPTSLAQPYVAAPVPLWLVHGLSQAIHDRNDMLLAVARRSVSAGRPPRAAELLSATESPADAAERYLFDANAWMLTESLLAVPDGPRKMQRFLAQLGVTKSTTNAFAVAYGSDFPQEAALEKWWSTQQARRAAAIVPQNLFAQETARSLDEILVTTLAQTRGREGSATEELVTIDGLWPYYEQPWLKPILTGKLNALETLRSHAHPMYRDVIDAYIAAINSLLGEHINRFKRAAEHAQHLRAAVDERVRQISECLDQTERSYFPEQARDSFRGYFQALDQMQSLEQQRRSPISDYLDQFDH